LKLKLVSTPGSHRICSWGVEVMQISGLTGSFLSSEPSRQTRAYLHCRWCSPVAPCATTDNRVHLFFAGPVWQATLILQPHGLLQVQDVTEASTPQTLLQASLHSVRVTPGHFSTARLDVSLHFMNSIFKRPSLFPPAQRVNTTTEGAAIGYVAGGA